MKERKIIFLLVFVIVIGMGITFLTGYLTGSVTRVVPRQQVAVSAGAEQVQTREQAVVVLTTAADWPEEAPEEETQAENTAQVYETLAAAGADGGSWNIPAPAGTDPQTAETVPAQEEPSGPVQEASMDPEADGPGAEIPDAMPADPSAETVEAPQSYIIRSGSAAGYPLDAAENGMLTAGEEVPNEVDGGVVLAGENPYLVRFEELNAQIQKNREEQESFSNSGANSSQIAKNTANTELRLWDNELNAIYNVILEKLDEERAAELVGEEREWLKLRDAAAAEAASKSAGGSLESVEYTASLAESTRSRCYELAEIYGDILEE